ncbi:hypothetical protein SXCC_04524 [Gluconacetobacter sp. SXCC-1]|nr:hypothetical protein SXCC_04524 [Gluconacetobacter sp. SXCC-1]
MPVSRIVANAPAACQLRVHGQGMRSWRIRSTDMYISHHAA